MLASLVLAAALPLALWPADAGAAVTVVDEVEFYLVEPDADYYILAVPPLPAPSSTRPPSPMTSTSRCPRVSNTSPRCSSPSTRRRTRSNHRSSRPPVLSEGRESPP